MKINKHLNQHCLPLRVLGRTSNRMLCPLMLAKIAGLRESFTTFPAQVGFHASMGTLMPVQRVTMAERLFALGARKGLPFAASLWMLAEPAASLGYLGVHGPHMGKSHIFCKKMITV